MGRAGSEGPIYICFPQEWQADGQVPGRHSEPPRLP